MAEPTLAEAYDVSLLDLDGCVYVGADPVPGAIDALSAASVAGMRHSYVTNNASRPPAVVAAHLRALGLVLDDVDVVTSAQAAAGLLADLVPAGAPVLVVGGDGLLEAVTERGLVPVRSQGDGPVAVIQGFAPDLTWTLLAEAAYVLADDDVPWIASNRDTTFPTARGTAPGNGTFVAALEAVVGRSPLVAGKPERVLFDETVARTGARRPLVVGDRLDTDIEGAVRAGLDSLLVLTGVTDVLGAIQAPPTIRPTFVAHNLGALTRPGRSAARDGDVWTCGRWVALVESDTVIVVPVPPGGEPVDAPAAGSPGDADDALTAACAAGWSYAATIRAVHGLDVGILR